MIHFHTPLEVFCFWITSAILFIVVIDICEGVRAAWRILCYAVRVIQAVRVAFKRIEENKEFDETVKIHARVAIIEKANAVIKEFAESQK